MRWYEVRPNPRGTNWSLVSLMISFQSPNLPSRFGSPVLFTAAAIRSRSRSGALPSVPTNAAKYLRFAIGMSLLAGNGPVHHRHDGDRRENSNKSPSQRPRRVSTAQDILGAGGSERQGRRERGCKGASGVCTSLRSIQPGRQSRPTATWVTHPGGHPHARTFEQRDWYVADSAGGEPDTRIEHIVGLQAPISMHAQGHEEEHGPRVVCVLCACCVCGGIMPET